MSGETPGHVPPGRGFRRNVVTLAGGTGLAQVIGIAATPLLTRLFSPDEFGLAAVWAAIVAILAIAVCGRYEVALVLPSSRQDALHLTALSLLVALIFTMGTLILVTLFGAPFARLIQAPDVTPWLWVAPLSVLALGVHQTLNYWYTRLERFRPIAVSHVSQSLATQGAQIGLGIMGGIGAGGLVLGRTAGHVTAAAVLSGRFVRDLSCESRITISWREIKRIGREYERFPRYLLVSHALNVVALQLPVFFISHTSTVLLGLFSLTLRLLGIPMSLLSASVAQVFYGEAARAAAKDLNCLPVYQRTFRKLSVLSLTVFVPLVLVPDQLYVYALGQEWNGMATIIRGIAPLYAIRFVVSPLNSMFLVRQRTDLYFVLQLGLFSAALVALGIAYVLGGGMKYVYAYTLASSVVLLVSLGITYHLAKQPAGKAPSPTG